MAPPQRLILALALLAGAAPAQPPTDGEIIVTGRRAAERREQARAFVRAVSPPPVDGQFARWNTPLCPTATGVAPPIATRVVDRIRDAAAQAGAPLAPRGCRPNAFVTFTPDARGLLGVMERKASRLLVSIPLADRRALRESTAPMLWWHGTHSEGSDGQQLSTMPSVAFGPIGTSGPAIPGDDLTRSGDTYRSSLIDTHLRVNIAHAVVLVDVPRSTGRRLDAVADHAAFVILARVRPAPQTGAGSTILNLFAGDPADAPRGLTAQDRAYLSALYAMPINRAAGTQARALIGAVAHALPVD